MQKPLKTAQNLAQTAEIQKPSSSVGFKGSEWDRPLNYKEFTIIWYVLREVSFLIDYVQEGGRQIYKREPFTAKYRSRKQPKSELLKPLCAWDNLLFDIVIFWMIYYSVVLLLWLLF